MLESRTCEMKQKERSKARELALKILFEQEFNKNLNTESLNPSDINETAQNYAQSLLKGIKTHQKKIDSLIRETSQFWTMERISLIDLNIMRIAVYEMLYSTPPVPFKVCIDEALKMAKTYGTENSSKFINGNLDTISKNTKELG